MRRPEPASNPPGMSTNWVICARCKQARERQVFSERNQMLLVVPLRRQPVAAHDLDRIEVVRRPALAVVASRRAGDQRRAGTEKVDDLRQRLRVARHDERKGRLGPDQMRDVPNPGSIRGGRALRQVEVAAQDRLLVLGAERGVVLGDVGLDQPQLDPRDRGAGRRRESKLAKGGHDDQRKSREDRRRQMEPVVAHPP